MAFYERTALLFQDSTRRARRPRGGRRQTVRPRRIRPALSGVVEITLTGGGHAHTGIANTRRAGHRGWGQLVCADQEARDRIDITPGSISRVLTASQLAARLAKTIANGISEILAVRTAPAPLVPGNQFRQIIMKPDARVTFALVADQGVLSEDFVAGTVKRRGDILVRLIDLTVVKIAGQAPTGRSGIKQIAIIVNPGMVVEYDILQGRTDNRFRMHHVISDLPGEHAATGRPVIIADHPHIQIHTPRPATRYATVARNIGQQGIDINLMARRTALRYGRLPQA